MDTGKTGGSTDHCRGLKDSYWSVLPTAEGNHQFLWVKRFNSPVASNPFYWPVPDRLMA